MATEEKPFTDLLNDLREKMPHLELPSNEKILSWKQQAPGNRLSAFVTPDQKRGYLLRGISGSELEQKHKLVPQNSSNPERDLENQVVAACVLWTNTTPGKKMDAETLSLQTAGLPKALYEIVGTLSDFYNPQDLFRYTLEF